MANTFEVAERRTSADIVFDHLYDEIISLRLLPGSKISEADIATRFGISRQPVRDAFSRLGNLGFLLIRPQKATTIKKFSMSAITAARFVRRAVELEVCRRAAENWTPQHQATFEANITEQRAAAEAFDVDAFHRLDYDFHRQLCEVAGVPYAFDAILENKAQVDRLCVLSLMDKDELGRLVGDHIAILDRLGKQDAEGLDVAMRLHLSRLDETITKVQGDHAEFFD